MSSHLRLWLPLLGALALYLLIGFIEQSAHDAGYSTARAKGELELARLRSTYQQQELQRARSAAAAAEAAADRLQQEQVRNDRLAANLAEQQRQHRQTTDRLSGEIARVNDLYRTALDSAPEPLPACVFTRGFVRLWDEASGAHLPASADSGRTAAQGAEARALEQLDSGLGQRALLAHHIRYAEQCRSTAAQLDALIDAVEGLH